MQDVWLVRELLVDHGAFHFTLDHRPSLEAALEGLKENHWQAVLVNLGPEATALRIVRRIRRECGDLPAVLLSESVDQAQMGRAFRAGAHDLLDKLELGSHLLVRTLRSAVERNRTAKQLLQERNLLRNIIDHLPDLIYAKDRQGRYILGNPAHAHHLGLPSEADVLGQTVHDLFPKEIADVLNADDLQVLHTGGRILNREEELPTPSGELRWMHTTKVPLRAADGTISGVVGITHDIHDRRRIADELRRANKELESALESIRKSHDDLKDAQMQLIQAEKMQSVGRLAAGIAHEVKNPLATLRMGIDFLRQQHAARPDNPTTGVLEEMSHAISRADGVIRELLDYSSARKASLAPGDIVSVVQHALRLSSYPLRSGHVRVRLEPAPGLPLIPLDPIKLEQAIVNLLLNAAHAMPEGGELIIRITPEASPPDMPHADGDRSGASTRLHGPHLLVSIADTGPGFTRESLEHAFDPFYTTKPTGKGTGLGLNVVRGIVELHSGTITLQNRPQGGAEIQIRLPAPAT